MGERQEGGRGCMRERGGTERETDSEKGGLSTLLPPTLSPPLAPACYRTHLEQPPERRALSLGGRRSEERALDERLEGGVVVKRMRPAST